MRPLKLLLILVGGFIWGNISFIFLISGIASNLILTIISIPFLLPGWAYAATADHILDSFLFLPGGDLITFLLPGIYGIIYIYFISLILEEFKSRKKRK